MPYYIFGDKTYEENAQLISNYIESRNKTKLCAYVSEAFKNIKHELCHNVFNRNNIYIYKNIATINESIMNETLLNDNHKYLTLFSAYMMLFNPTHKIFSFRQFEFYYMCTNILNINADYVYFTDVEIQNFLNKNPFLDRHGELAGAFHNNKLVGPSIIKQFRNDNLRDILESMSYKCFITQLKLNPRLITQLTRLYLKHY